MTIENKKMYIYKNTNNKIWYKLQITKPIPNKLTSDCIIFFCFNMRFCSISKFEYLKCIHRGKIIKPKKPLIYPIT